MKFTHCANVLQVKAGPWAPDQSDKSPSHKVCLRPSRMRRLLMCAKNCLDSICHISASTLTGAMPKGPTPFLENSCLHYSVPAGRDPLSIVSRTASGSIEQVLENES